ncbi:MAG TPA: MFS transporter [Bacillota bacterium]
MFWLRVATLGMGYLAAQTVWALYNAYLPLFYGQFIASNALIGLVMIIDNIASVTAQPAFAAQSDRTRTRLGRRVPYLLVGMPLAAACFALIPRAPTLAGLLAATLLMNLGIAIFTTPNYALMADITPAGRLGRANGIVNAMGGLGALVAFFVLNPLYVRNPALPFDATGLLLAAALVLVLVAVPERRLVQPGLQPEVAGSPAGPDPAAADPTGGARGQARIGADPPAADPPPEGALRLTDLGGVLSAVRAVLTNPDRRCLYLLLGALFWVAAVNGAQNMFTRYGVEHLGLSPADATFLLGFFALAFIAGSVPAGLVGDRMGRIPAIRLGAAGILATFVMMMAVGDAGTARYVFLFGGICWALIIINAYPVLLELTPRAQAGTYTGLWNVVIALAGLISPPLYGAVVDGFGFDAFFWPGIVFLALGLASILAFRGRETAPAAVPPATGSRAG